VRADADEIEGLIEGLSREIATLKSRVRILEGRLQDRALTLSDKTGKTKRVRLGVANTLEVE
jgi:hypothetical protein